MLKTRESTLSEVGDHAGDQRTEVAHLTARTEDAKGVVHWFVDPVELRKKLSMMAGAELVGALLGAMT